MYQVQTPLTTQSPLQIASTKKLTIEDAIYLPKNSKLIFTLDTYDGELYSSFRRYFAKLGLHNQKEYIISTTQPYTKNPLLKDKNPLNTYDVLLKIQVPFQQDIELSYRYFKQKI